MADLCFDGSVVDVSPMHWNANKIQILERWSVTSSLLWYIKSFNTPSFVFTMLCVRMFVMWYLPRHQRNVSLSPVISTGRRACKHGNTIPVKRYIAMERNFGTVLGSLKRMVTVVLHTCNRSICYRAIYLTGHYTNGYNIILISSTYV